MWSIFDFTGWLLLGAATGSPRAKECGLWSGVCLIQIDGCRWGQQPASLLPIVGGCGVISPLANVGLVQCGLFQPHLLAVCGSSSIPLLRWQCIFDRVGGWFVAPNGLHF